MNINISRAHFPVTTLGPGRRVGIWTQGCSIRCAGCISADTWSFGLGGIQVATLIDDLYPWLAECDGVTISGGEPFDQYESLRAVLSLIKVRFDKNVLVFSGYALERIESELAGLNGLIDAVVSDPFDIQQPQSLALRGSDNQRLTTLTERGHACFGAYNRAAKSEDRILDVMFGEDGVAWMAGIPTDEGFIRIENTLTNAGHQVLTSRSKGRRK